MDRGGGGALQPRPWNSTDRRRLVLVTAAALLLFTYGLGVGTLWDQDEPKYVQVAKELLQTGDPFTLRLDGRPWFVHPPLYFWLEAAAGWLVGFTEFTARIWSALAGAGMVAGTFLLAQLFYDARTALLAAAVTATTMGVLVQARLAAFDPPLVAFMVLALYMFLVGYTTGSRRASLWAWGWAGLATATKGPIGLLLPAMVVVALWAVRREWRRWRDQPALGPILYAAIGLPWYVIETIRWGEEFLRTAVGYYMVTRFFGVVEDQPGPWWYYGPVLVLGTFPWTAFVPASLVWLWRRRGDLASQVILLWCGITVAFYSAAGTKLPNYVLPVYPVLAVAVGRFWTAVIDGLPEVRRLGRWAFALLPVASLLLVAGVAVYGSTKYPAEAAALRPVVAIATAALAAGPMVAWTLARRPSRAFAALVLTSGVGVAVMVHHTLPALEAHRPIPRIALMLRHQMRPGDALVAVRMSLSASLRFYSGQTVIWVETPSDLTRALCEHTRAFLVIPAAEEAAWAGALLPPGTRLQGEDGGYRIFLKDGWTACGPPPPR